MTDALSFSTLGGLQVGPVILLTPLVLLALPGAAGFVTLSAVLVAVGLVALVIAWRWITFERYLS